MAVAFKSVWESYCRRHNIDDNARGFAMDLMDRATDVMRARARQVAEDHRDQMRTLAAQAPEARRALAVAEAIVSEIEQLSDG